MMITIASRQSLLAKAQVEEVLKELNLHHPYVSFSCTFLDTTGDKDQKTSLRTLDKTDFFTKEIDNLLLSGCCRVGIHSAKDLPDPLPNGLSIAAITRGINPSDSLVLKEGITPFNFSYQPLIATSSERREEAVKKIMPHAIFTDIRGTIHQRLQVLNENRVDGVVIAEAALIRLGLTNLNRVTLPGKTTPLQGQLAVIVREDDVEIHTLFACMDNRIAVQ
jgi:hydroxymethylbilane synthase